MLLRCIVAVPPPPLLPVNWVSKSKPECTALEWRNSYSKLQIVEMMVAAAVIGAEVFANFRKFMGVGVRVESWSAVFCGLA